MGSQWLGALALVLIIEGLMPLINPRAWRETFARILRLQDGQLRFIGLLAVASGALLWVLSQAL